MNNNRDPRAEGPLGRRLGGEREPSTLLWTGVTSSSQERLQMICLPRLRYEIAG